LETKTITQWLIKQIHLPVDFFSGENFFSSKVPEFLHALFNLVVKHSSVRGANRGMKKNRGKIQDLN